MPRILRRSRLAEPMGRGRPVGLTPPPLSQAGPLFEVPPFGGLVLDVPKHLLPPKVSRERLRHWAAALLAIGELAADEQLNPSLRAAWRSDEDTQCGVALAQAAHGAMSKLRKNLLERLRSGMRLAVAAAPKSAGAGYLGVLPSPMTGTSLLGSILDEMSTFGTYGDLDPAKIWRDRPTLEGQESLVNPARWTPGEAEDEDTYWAPSDFSVIARTTTAKRMDEDDEEPFFIAFASYLKPAALKKAVPDQFVALTRDDFILVNPILMRPAWPVRKSSVGKEMALGDSTGAQPSILSSLELVQGFAAWGVRIAAFEKDTLGADDAYDVALVVGETTGKVFEGVGAAVAATGVGAVVGAALAAIGKAIGIATEIFRAALRFLLQDETVGSSTYLARRVHTYTVDDYERHLPWNMSFTNGRTSYDAELEIVLGGAVKLRDAKPLPPPEIKTLATERYALDVDRPEGGNYVWVVGDKKDETFSAVLDGVAAQSVKVSVEPRNDTIRAQVSVKDWKATVYQVGEAHPTAGILTAARTDVEVTVHWWYDGYWGAIFFSNEDKWAVGRYGLDLYKKQTGREYDGDWNNGQAQFTLHVDYTFVY